LYGYERNYQLIEPCLTSIECWLSARRSKFQRCIRRFSV